MKKTLLTILAIAGLTLLPTSAYCHGGCEELASLDLQEITVGYSSGVMHITGAAGQMVTIYNLAGIAVKTFRVEGSDKRVSLSLSEGVYIVKVGDSFTRKISVRR